MKNKLGVNIASLRKAKGWSQKETAKKLGISQALLSHYEKGIRECGLEFLVNASQIFNCSTDYLLGLKTSKSNADEDIDNISADLKEMPKLDKNRYDVINTLNLLYSITARIGNPEICKDFNNIIFSNLYQLLNIFQNRYFSADLFEKEQMLNFTLAQKSSANSLMSLINRLNDNNIYLKLTKEQLSSEYPLSSNSLFYILNQF